MSKPSYQRYRVLPPVVFLIGIGLWSIGRAPSQAAEPERSLGVHGDRTRITLAFHANPAAVQRRLPTPWQLSPPRVGL